MAVPDFQTLMLPLLKLASGGQQHTLAEAIERLAQEFQLSDDDRAQLLGSGQTRLYNRVGWTTTYLKKAGLLQAVAPEPEWPATDRNVLEFINGHVFDPTDFVIRTDGVCRFEPGNGRCMVGLAGRS
jgi:restriction endonuclease Mrr